MHDAPCEHFFPGLKLPQLETRLIAFQPFLYRINCDVRLSRAQKALPDDRNAPALFFQHILVPTIAFDSCFEFWQPEFSARFWCGNEILVDEDRAVATSPVLCSSL